MIASKSGKLKGMSRRNTNKKKMPIILRWRRCWNTYYWTVWTL